MYFRYIRWCEYLFIAHPQLYPQMWTVEYVYLNIRVVTIIRICVLYIHIFFFGEVGRKENNIVNIVFVWKKFSKIAWTVTFYLRRDQYDMEVI